MKQFLVYQKFMVILLAMLGANALFAQKYEAENAALTSVSIANDPAASGGQYVHMQDSGSLAFTVHAETAGTYTLSIAYYLPYGTKEQQLEVNGTSQGNVVFDGTVAQWNVKSLAVSLNAGDNTVVIRKSWGYMFFDYVEKEGGQQNIAPVAHAGMDVDKTILGNQTSLQVVLDGTASTDADGTIVSYIWNENGAQIATGAQPTVALEAGTHTISLMVTDQAGATATDHVVIRIHTENATNRININGEQIFLNGGNLAWNVFANDVGANATDLAFFEQAIADFAAHGGNSMRFWVHINGANNPLVNSDGYTLGLEPTMIQDLRDILDIAYDHNVVVNLCLWSFDMLHTVSYPIEVSQRGKKLLTIEENVQAYIDSALVPMVEGLKGHEALLSWEIFNEPEGMSNEFGWSFTTHVPMSTIQRFVNRCAGAIHRADPNAKVTNGAWSFKANTDIFSGVEKNYYSDSALVAAGGDSLGTLDYYQVHYYDWAGTTYSPFVHPASHWKLDKPIVIGEFFVEDAPGGFSKDSLYKVVYENGYAGAWGWQYIGEWDGTTQQTEPYRTEMLEGMASIAERADIKIDADRNHKPKVTGSISNFRTDMNSPARTDFVDLNTIFSDPEGSVLSFSVACTPANVIVPTVNGSKLSFVYATGAKGMVEVAITATDSGTPAASRTYKFNVLVAEPGQGNLALYQKTSASTVEPGPNTAASVNDGNRLTRWSSLYVDPSWVAIEFDQEYAVNEVHLHWENSYSSQYEIQVSQDGLTWTTVYTEPASDGGEDHIAFPSVNCKHIRMYGVARVIPWGHSIYEFEVYGDVPKSISAHAGADQFLNDSDANGTETISLDGSASVDTEQSIVSYVWSENGSQIATGVTPTIDLAVGDHTITLTVTNNLGISSTDVVFVHVLAAGCMAEDMPLATHWQLANDWTDQSNGSGVSNGSGALAINHRKWGKTDIWLMQTGMPVALEAGKPVAIDFDFKGASAPAVVSVEAAFVTNWDDNGPVNYAHAKTNVGGTFGTTYGAHSLTITPSFTGTAYLAFYIVFDAQPDKAVSYYLKNLMVCSEAAAAKKNVMLEEKTEAAPQVFPNPINRGDVLYLKHLKAQSNLEVYTLDGTLLKRIQIQENQNQIRLSSLSSGVYMLRIRSGEQQFTQKLLVR